MITEQDVLAALQTVPGPDGRPLPASGALAGLSIQSGKVYLSIAADPSRPDAAEPARTYEAIVFEPLLLHTWR